MVKPLQSLGLTQNFRVDLDAAVALLAESPPVGGVDIGSILLDPGFRYGWNEDGYFGDTAFVYEVEERLRYDEHLVHRKLQELVSQSSGVAADLNAGTGISTRMLTANPTVSDIFAVDIEPNFLEFNEYLTRDPRVQYHVGDTLEVLPTLPMLDTIVLSFAYHHFPDDMKGPLMEKVGDQLTDDGRVYIGEILIPSYTDENSRIDGLRSLYAKAADYSCERYMDDWRTWVGDNLVFSVEHTHWIPHFIRGCAAKVVEYDIAKEHEFKVDKPTLLRHIDEGGLKIVEEHHVWPTDRSLGDAGNYVFVLEKA